MGQMTTSQARIIDPVLTGIAQGFKQLDAVGGLLFPAVRVGARAGKVIKFGKEDFMLYATQRSPGENTKRVGFGYAADPFALVDYSLEGSLPIEVQQEATSGAGGFSIDAASMTLRKVASIMDLRLEFQQAQIARTAASYPATNKITLSGTSQWSDFTSGVSDPIKVVEAAKDAIRKLTGKRPNVMIMGPDVMTALKQHPKIIERLKYTTSSVPDAAFLGSLFGVSRVVVGESITATDAGVFSDVWGKDVVLAYTELSSVADMGTPTFGYTYQLAGYPLAEEAYYGRNEKTWYFPVTRAEAPVLTSAISGYLITNAVA